MFDRLPFALRVLLWPFRFLGLLGLGFLGVVLACVALLVLIGGEPMTALAVGLLAGLCFEVRHLIA